MSAIRISVRSVWTEKEVGQQGFRVVRGGCGGIYILFYFLLLRSATPSSQQTVPLSQGGLVA